LYYLLESLGFGGATTKDREKEAVEEDRKDCPLARHQQREDILDIRR